MNHWLAFLNKPESLKEKNFDCDQQEEMRDAVSNTSMKSPEKKPFRGRRSQAWIESEASASTTTGKFNTQDNVSSDIVSKMSSKRFGKNRSESWASSKASSPSGNVSTLEKPIEGNVVISPNKFLQRGSLPTVGIGSQALSPAGKPSTLGNVSPNKFTTYKAHNNIEVSKFSSTPTKLPTNVREPCGIPKGEQYVLNSENMDANIEVVHLENVFCSSRTSEEERSEYIKLREIRLSSSSNEGSSMSRGSNFPNMSGEVQLQNKEITALRERVNRNDDNIKELEELRRLNNTKIQKIEYLQKSLHDERKAASKRLRIAQDRFRKEITKIREEELSKLQNKNTSNEERHEVEEEKTCLLYTSRCV